MPMPRNRHDPQMIVVDGRPGGVVCRACNRVAWFDDDHGTCSEGDGEITRWLGEKCLPSIQSYGPNQRDAIHVVEIKLQDWEYTRTFYYDLRGNCRGWDVMDDPAFLLLNWWMDRNDIDGVTRIDDEAVNVELLNANGDSLSVEIWTERDLEEMIVSVRIVEVRSEEGDANAIK